MFSQKFMTAAYTEAEAITCTEFLRSSWFHVIFKKLFVKYKTNCERF